MEEDADDLDNLFDEYDSNDPQPQENANNENAENDVAAPERVPVPKRVVKHPRLKFNPERLCGKRGIPILVDHFKDVKFKGKGHEKEDLNKLLTTLELWSHRLFPSMKFEDCLRQIEHLGKKRPVKTCVQKIRLDFPILDRDFVHNEDAEEQPNELEPEPPAQDAFDRLFDDYRERPQPDIASTSSSSQVAGNVLGTSFGASFSEEQKKRMEYNKMLAIERRKAKLSSMQSSSLFGSDGTTNVGRAGNSPPIKKRDRIDPNFLFDYLQEQFTNDEDSTVNKKTEKKFSQSVQPNDGMMESIDDHRDASELDMLPNKNNDTAEGNNNEELELDELMDLVDEDDDETHHNTLPNFKNKDCTKSNDKEELRLDESMNSVGENDQNTINVDRTDQITLSHVKNNGKYDIDPDALPNVGNNDCPETNNKEELGLDELMDSVGENDQNTINVDRTDQITLSHVKNNGKYDIYPDALPNVENNDCPETNNKEELGLDELMDLVEGDDKHESALPLKNDLLVSDNYAQDKCETNVNHCNEQTTESDA